MKSNNYVYATTRIVLLLCTAIATQSFWLQPHQFINSPKSKQCPAINSPTILFGRKAKRGRLGNLADVTPSEIRKVERTQTKKAKRATAKKTTGGKDATISPDLAAWMATKEDDSSGAESFQPLTPKICESENWPFEKIAGL